MIETRLESGRSGGGDLGHMTEGCISLAHQLRTSAESPCRVPRSFSFEYLFHVRISTGLLRHRRTVQVPFGLLA